MKKILYSLIFFIGCCQNDNVNFPIEEKDDSKNTYTDSYPGSLSLIHNGINREYYVYFPSSYTKDSIAPVMINFHGGGGNISDVIEYSDMRRLSDLNGFILV